MAASIPGPKLKEYIFTEKLGSGTYATVYKAYKKGGQREVVAVKCVRKSSLNKASTENLLTEIELLKSLKHEHIVELRDFLWDQDYIYLIMEYCSGGDLSKFIQSRRILPEHIAKHFLQQMALALQYMRSKNVSHMDLKPQNILLSATNNPVLKIADFGFASYLIGDTEGSSLRGSPLYMAPEIILKKHYSEKLDLWSTGVILYECLFGRAPFASRSLKELEDKIIDTKPIEIPHSVRLSKKCRHLLHGLLQRDPDKRISFDDFFTDPFLDLNHRPSNQALPKAVELVTQAVERDGKNDYQNAVNLYCQALEYFVAAVHYETDVNKKESLRKKVKEYMRRAEELKQVMKPQVPRVSSAVKKSSLQPYDELVKLSLMANNAPLTAALKVIRDAETKEEAEDYTGAMKKYELALETFLKVLNSEPRGRLKDLLQSQVTDWMSRAESVKNYLKVAHLETKDSSLRDDEEDSKAMSSCLIQ